MSNTEMKPGQIVYALAVNGIEGRVRLGLTRHLDREEAEVRAALPWVAACDVLWTVRGNWKTQASAGRIATQLGGVNTHGDWWELPVSEALRIEEALNQGSGKAAMTRDDRIAQEVALAVNLKRMSRPLGFEITDEHRALADKMNLAI